ncbi:GtrA family protein [Phenylobacterium sp. LjRoot225]|uniref:GtrA family protein n=1 Tax=Phenylobacterium sp. LjRoot225 TaxID=3342285 RepID=UPI003ECD1D87
MTSLDLKREAGLLARFGGAGLITTAVGLAVILALDVGLGVDRRLANAAGYLVGAGLGLGLQKAFVFRQATPARGAAGRYAAVMIFAFALNQAVLTLAGLALPQTALGHAAAQLLAMATYTATQFALFRLWVFRPAA